MGYRFDLAAAALAAGVAMTPAAHAADAKDAAATTCMATVGKPHEVKVGAKAPVILQKLAETSSLPNKGDRCDRVDAFANLPSEHQQLVKDLYEEWKQKFSSIPEDDLVSSMSALIKILALLPEADKYLNDITTANEQHKNDPRGLLAELKKLPREPALLGMFGTIARKLKVSADDLVAATPSLKPMYAKAKALTKTTEIVTKVVEDLTAERDVSRDYLASIRSQTH